MPEQMTLNEERQERSQHLVSRCDMSIEDIRSEIDFILGQPKREWVGLTDEETWGVYRTHGLSFHRPNHVEEYEWALCMRDFARDIEAKLKEKNT